MISIKAVCRFDFYGCRVTINPDIGPDQGLTAGSSIRHVRQALRDATLRDHQQVDALFTDFSFGSIASYASFLRAHARALAPLEAVARPTQPRFALLADDLAVMGQIMPSPLPLEPAAGSAFRWGVLYALEGSRLGGAMLARRVPAALPRTYLSAVHGKGGWVAFQHALDAAAMQGGEGWIDEAVRGAQTAFALFAQAARMERSADRASPAYPEQAMPHG